MATSTTKKKASKTSLEENAVKEHILKADQASRQPAVTGNLLEPEVAAGGYEPVGEHGASEGCDCVLAAA
jgi:hypothetical protein